MYIILCHVFSSARVCVDVCVHDATVCIHSPDKSSFIHCLETRTNAGQCERSTDEVGGTYGRSSVDNACSAWELDLILPWLSVARFSHLHQPAA